MSAQPWAKRPGHETVGGKNQPEDGPEVRHAETVAGQRARDRKQRRRRRRKRAANAGAGTGNQDEGSGAFCRHLDFSINTESVLPQEGVYNDDGIWANISLFGAKKRRLY